MATAMAAKNKLVIFATAFAVFEPSFSMRGGPTKNPIVIRPKLTNNDTKLGMVGVRGGVRVVLDG